VFSCKIEVWVVSCFWSFGAFALSARLVRRLVLVPLPTFPAKAGIQIQPERLVGFIWAPAFAGETGKGNPVFVSV
jgi:hypothetical protein